MTWGIIFRYNKIIIKLPTIVDSQDNRPRDIFQFKTKGFGEAWKLVSSFPKTEKQF